MSSSVIGVINLNEKENIIVRTPVTDDAPLMSLKAGDVFYITGTIVTARDAVHERVIVEGMKLPIDLKGLAIFHAGPVMVREKDVWKCVSIGPTTSRRMEYFEYEFIERTGVKIIIGKGGMGLKTAEACKKYKAVYAIFPGGCGVLGASAVRRVAGVEWLDLGVPEALWILEVEKFGPLIVTIDTYGNNLADEIVNNAMRKRESIVQEALRRFSEK
jgi:tartrate/fumarate subfamily iron-sulfur-dependent hydro-lyase beta chain